VRRSGETGCWWRPGARSAEPLVLLATAVGVAATYLVTQVGEGVVFGLRRDLVGHLLGQSATFFSSTRGGDVLSRVLNDVAGVNASLSTHLMTGVRSGLSVASMLVLIVVIDWRLTLLALLVLPVVVLAVRRADGRIGRAQSEVQDQLSAMTSYLQETLGLLGMMLVRAFGPHGAERRRFDAVNAELRDRQVARAMTGVPLLWFGEMVERSASRRGRSSTSG